ncbi:MAG: ankyrin repeat domain-containing protein, partial [Verrucomicrobia bacterium]|nr:ankyrin repeat domain-containing protein [Verrucomicrobiota bacterium]
MATKILECFSAVLSKLQLQGLREAGAQIATNYESDLSGPYLEAYKGGQLESVPQQFLNDPDPVTGLTLLHCAALNGQIEVLKYLLSQGADPHLVTPSGQTALHCAALKNQTEAVEYLLSQGCDINAQDKQGSTPLHYAMMHEKTHAAFQLLRQGADPHRVNKYDLSPLAQFAACIKERGDHRDVLRLHPSVIISAIGALGLDMPGGLEE